MKSERLTEIRRVAAKPDFTAPEHIIRALRELLVYVDGLASEYTADPPREPLVRAEACYECRVSILPGETFFRELTGRALCLDCHGKRERTRGSRRIAL